MTHRFATRGRGSEGFASVDQRESKYLSILSILDYKKINEISNLPKEYEFLNQDFVSRLLNFFIFLKTIIPLDIVLFIFELYIYKIHYIYLEPYKEHKNKDCLTHRSASVDRRENNC
jgi:hypothetical protein